MDQSGASETAIGIASAATKKAVSLPEGNNCKTTSIRGLSAVGEHLLGDYPTVGSNGLESRTTKSEFFWVYFGVFLALGLRDRKRDPKTLIIYFIKNPIRCAATPRISLTRSELI